MKNWIFIVLICRILLPFLIFKFPLYTLFLSLFFDHIDAQLFYNSGLTWKVYNRYDKLLDYWWYTLILIYFWLNIPTLFTLALILFIFRSIGQFIGIFFNTEKVYLLFPNVLERLFLIVMVFPKANIAFSLIASIVIALIVEWSIHFRKIHLISKYIYKKEIIWERNERSVKKKGL